MIQLQLLGHENEYNRDIFLSVLDFLDVEFQVPQSTRQFTCLCVFDARSVDNASIREFCRTLITLGCAYLCCWGPDCERVHDLMDREVVGENPPESYLGCLMTTWHAKDSLEAAVNFFLTCTEPDEGYSPAGCDWGLTIVIGSHRWASEAKQLLSAKLYKAG